MSCIRINSDHHRILASVLLLECGGILKGVSWNHPVVMISGGDKNSRIILISRDVVNR